MKSMQLLSLARGLVSRRDKSTACPRKAVARLCEPLSRTYAASACPLSSPTHQHLSVGLESAFGDYELSSSTIYGEIQWARHSRLVCGQGQYNSVMSLDQISTFVIIAGLLVEGVGIVAMSTWRLRRFSRWQGMAIHGIGALLLFGGIAAKVAIAISANIP